MIPIEKRVQQQTFTAFAAYESIESVWDRVQRLVKCGRPMIYIERWMDGGGIRVAPGLHIHQGGLQPGAHFHQDHDTAFFQLTLMPGIHALGAGAWARDGSEAHAADRFHRDKKDAIRIHIQGFGLGLGDHIEITDYNNYGVGWQRSLYFQYDSCEVRAEREAAFLDGLAAHGRWSAGQLARLAIMVRHDQGSMLDVAAAIRAKVARS